MASSNLKERDVVHWLEKKICASSSFNSGGSALEVNGLWGSRHVCSLINQELLTEIPPCFVDLQTSTKLKLLLSLLHLTKRNIDQWRDEIEEILTLANQDTDEWVQTIAELLKELPTTGGLSLSMSNEESQFTKALQLLKKILKKQSKESFQMLPLDAAFVNKTTLQAIWGSNIQPSKHFTLKRKPKAAAQRIELLQKSVDAATQLKNKTRSVSSVVPIKERNMVRKMDANGPLPKIPTLNAVKASSGFSNCSKVYNRPTLTKKEGGVKLIDIQETPEMLRIRRKKMELEEKAAKKAAKEETKRMKMEMKAKKPRFSESIDEELLAEECDEDERSEMVPPTPNYAADLADASLLAAPTNVEDSHKSQQQPVSLNSLKQSVTTTTTTTTATATTTASLQFVPLTQSYMSTSSNETSVVDSKATSSARTSVITDTQVSTAGTSNASFLQPPSLYSNFAAAFMQPQLSTRPVNSNNSIPSQQFVRTTVAQQQPATSFAAPTSSSSSSSQGMQMLRITLGGQPQTVIFQNPSLQPVQSTQNRAVFVVGQTGLTPVTTAPVLLNTAKDQQNVDRKGATLPAPRDFTAPLLQSTPQQQQQQLQLQQQFRESSGGLPVLLQSSANNASVAKSTGTPSLSQQPAGNIAGHSTGAASAPTQIILTKEIMYQAQEMFRTANKLSRPEKALILGFMAGNRENPCPQMGNILTVRLSENQEGEVRQEDGSTFINVVETFFQMNYENGEWKKIRKIRHVSSMES